MGRVILLDPDCVGKLEPQLEYKRFERQMALLIKRV